MLCEFCFQGNVLNAKVKNTSEIICICDECDTVWYKKDSVVCVTNYYDYMSERNLPALWNEIIILTDCQ